MGGVILLAVDAAYNIKDLTAPGLLPYLASAFVGCIVGWIYDIGTRMSEVASESIREMTRLSKVLAFQQPPLQLLVNAGRHASTVGVLLEESIGEQYKTIALVDPNKYLFFLRDAVDNTVRFYGIMRNTVSWFRDNPNGGSYLRDLGQRSLREKTRIFIIDNGQVPAMLRELADRDLMSFYWQGTGTVDTYWITEADYRSNYPELSLPQDCAVFDELLIRYDAARLTVSFDIVDQQALELRIFDKLRLQLQNENDRPFTRIPEDPA